MNGNDLIRIKICPRCRKEYHGYPAVSRQDNKTLICSDCGTFEALKSIGIKPQEQEQILSTIHRSIQE